MYTEVDVYIMFSPAFRYKITPAKMTIRTSRLCEPTLGGPGLETPSLGFETPSLGLGSPSRGLWSQAEAWGPQA